MSEIISTYLADHPAPWTAEREPGGLYQILDNDGGTVDCNLTPLFSEFVTTLINQRHANSEILGAVAGEISVKLEEARRERDEARGHLYDTIRERDDAIANAESWHSAFDNVSQGASELRDEMAELHDIIAAQRELIDGLQRRLDRLETRP